MILITGATGRIGNVLVKKLSENNEKIRILIRKTSDLTPLKGLKFETVFGDVTDYKSILNAVDGCDYVYHLAGFINISDKNKDLTFDTNIIGTENIVKACVAKKVKRLLYVSSIHAFTVPDKTVTIDETIPLCENISNRGLYDKSKASATCFVLKATKEDLDAVIVCPTGVIGPYDYRPSFFGQGMIDSVKSGLKYSVPGGYDYVDVRSVVDGIISAMHKGRKSEIYILGGEYLSMERYYKILRELTGIKGNTQILSFAIAKIIGFFTSLFSKNASITPYSLSTLISNSKISHEKAVRELGYTPLSVEQSIKDQYNWFVERGMII